MPKHCAVFKIEAVGRCSRSTTTNAITFQKQLTTARPSVPPDRFASLVFNIS